MRKVPGWWHGVALLAVASALLAPTMLLGCKGKLAYDPQRAYRDVVKQCELGPRLPGSEASRQAGEYIAAQLRAAGWAVDVQSFSYRGVDLRNVIARKGQGPMVLLGAHYDSRALASRDSEKPTAPVPGANDGASGVAVLLELGRTLDARRLRNEVWLVFFDAEDQGGIDQWPWSVGARQVAASLTTRPEFVVVVGHGHYDPGCVEGGLPRRQRRFHVPGGYVRDDVHGGRPDYPGG